MSGDPGGTQRARRVIRARLKRSRDPGKQGRYEGRKLDGLCVQCGAAAAPDRELCPKHLEAARKANAASKKAAREAERAKGLCATGCGRPSATYRCFVCSVRAGEKPAESAQNTPHGVHAGVHAGRARTHPRTVAITEGDGRTRNRGVGQTRRGRVSFADQDAQDARHIATQVERAIVELAAAHSVTDLPKTQRADRLHAALARFDLVQRFIGELLDRHRYVR